MRVLAAAVLVATAVLHAQAPHDVRPLYVMPLWRHYASVEEARFAREVQELRHRLGPGNARVGVGFSTYIDVSMDRWDVDPTRPDAVRAGLASTIARIDAAVDRARRNGIPLCIQFLFAIREASDPVQKAAEQEDRRNMQWYADNTLASGWVTHSRYARKQRRILEAYTRELGRVVANRMSRFPETLVAATGDGEVELAYGKSPLVDPSLTPDTMLLADYSSFAIAEFRDWLRAGGLYSPGAPFEKEAYGRASRYAGDRSPASDTNRDGHTLNGDFGTAFTTWALRDFDWSLDDDPMRDPHAIPATVYNSPDWQVRPAANPGGFDPPRRWRQGEAWSDVWHQFRQTMVWRHNRDVARWVTTSRDPETGTTVAAARWYSDQIPADRLFGASPENPNLRFITSASAWWSADISPYGRLGITSFNTNVSGTMHRTLVAVAPKIAERDVDWGITEWHPSAPASPLLQVYRDETRLVQLYRPGLVVPIFWGDPVHQIQDSGFEIALREMIAAVGKGPLKPALESSAARLNFATGPNGLSTPAQSVDVQVIGRGRVNWRITGGDPRIALSVTSGTSSARVVVSVRDPRAVASDVRTTLTLASPDASTPPVTIQVLVRPLAAPPAPPNGSFDAPAEGAALAKGLLLAGGWAVDDVGVTKVEVWREPLAGERPPSNGLIRLGEATRGARPDVAAIIPDAPYVDRAGWNFQYDLSGLARTERHTCRIHVLVTDVEGNVKDLGTRAVTIQR